VRSRLRRAERLVAAGIAVQLLVAVPSAFLVEPATTPTAHANPGARADAERQQITERTAPLGAHLARRSKAVLERDRSAFLADLDPTQKGFVAKQGLVFDHLTAVRFASWAYAVDEERYRASTPELDALRGEWWSPDVELKYAIAGYDTVPTEEPQGLTFVHRAGRWYLASDDDFAKDGHPTQRDLWDTGAVRVSTGTSCLVLSHPKGAGMAALALRECELSVPRVTAFWGTGWQRKVVLVVPDSSAELQKLVPGIGDVSNIAAVATAELTDPATGYHPVGDRVVVNPRSFKELGPVGRRVVLTHEVTHVASRAATGPFVPTWMVEGLADYVGFLGAGVPLSASAYELRKAVRAGRVPVELPIDSEFQGGREDLAETYEMSWLAVTLLVKTYGKAGFLALYREIGTAQSAGAIDLAFAKHARTTLARFTQTWIADLKRQLL
jgi:hypothetical protein